MGSPAPALFYKKLIKRACKRRESSVYSPPRHQDDMKNDLHRQGGFCALKKRRFYDIVESQTQKRYAGGREPR